MDGVFFGMRKRLQRDLDGTFWPRARSRLVCGLVDGITVLDVGCGSGLQAIALQKKGFRVTGADLSEEMVAEARANAKRSGSDAVFVCGDIGSIKGRFDSVLLLDVLEHVEDDEAFMRRVKRLVNRGGSILVTVPAHQFLWGVWDETFGHFRRYSTSRLRSVAESAGLRVERMSYWNFLGLPAAFLLNRLCIRYPSRSVSSTFLDRLLLAWFSAFENKLRMPLGVSIVMKARVV